MNSKKYKKVAVGGTFDKFHDGHKKLLSTAFEIGDHIEIGVTSNEFGGLKGDIDSCKERMQNLKSFFSDKSNFHVVSLDDPYGTTIYDEDIEAIVVSEIERIGYLWSDRSSALFFSQRDDPQA